MKHLAKLAALLLSVAMLVTVAGCNKGEDPAAGKGGAANKDFKVGVIHIGDPADGAGYSYAHDQGIKVGRQPDCPQD